MLEPVKLDDLTWNEMVVAIRRRIAAASAGNWTLHAPVDPGVTLLELFAFLLEQRVYWMDQIPDSLVRGALTLLGEAPKPTQAAATVVHFPTVKKEKPLPADIQLKLERSTPPLVFSTQHDVLLLPLENNHPGLFINNRNRTADLLHGKVMRLVPLDGKAGEVRIELRASSALPPGDANQRFSLLFELNDSSGMEPQWSPDAPKLAPPPAKVSWFYRGPGGLQLPFAEKEVEDGTGGLRRSGLVLFPVKSDWEPEASFKYTLWMRVDKPTFSAPPRLKRLIPNVVIASHQRKTGEYKLTEEFLPLPGNEIALSDLPTDRPVKDHPPIENTIKLSIREADGKWHDDWEPTADFSFHGPSSRVFIVDRLLGKIQFGDGLTGRLPVIRNDKNPQFKIQYSVGGGLTGRLGADRNWELYGDKDADPNDEPLKIGNVVRTEGGREPEAISAARARASTELRRRTRAVIREDYEEIATSIPGIAIKRAHAAIGLHPAHSCPIPGAVTVFVVPDVSRPDVLSEDSLEFDGELVESAFVAAPVPDPGALAVIRAKLQEARLAGSEVSVFGPRYRPVEITLDVESNSVDPANLSNQIRRRLRTFLDPLIGGDAGDGWPFGEPVRPSAILREAQAALGEYGSIARILVELPDASEAEQQTVQDSESQGCSCSEPPQPCETENGTTGSNSDGATCADVLIGAHELVELRRLTINFDRTSETEGGLR